METYRWINQSFYRVYSPDFAGEPKLWTRVWLINLREQFLIKPTKDSTLALTLEIFVYTQNRILAFHQF